MVERVLPVSAPLFDGRQDHDGSALVGMPPRIFSSRATPLLASPRFSSMSARLTAASASMASRSFPLGRSRRLFDHAGCLGRLAGIAQELGRAQAGLEVERRVLAHLHQHRQRLVRLALLLQERGLRERDARLLVFRDAEVARRAPATPARGPGAAPIARARPGRPATRRPGCCRARPGRPPACSASFWLPMPTRKRAKAAAISGAPSERSTGFAKGGPGLVVLARGRVDPGQRGQGFDLVGLFGQGRAQRRLGLGHAPCAQ
jgi:hypothetical protein